MILYHLNGCAPTPLAHYLKALGILRLVAEQLDPEARGWWEGERFALASQKNEEEIMAFFLESYRPTPLVSPWNKGSGFYYDKDPGLSPVEFSTADRFAPLRRGIDAARAHLHAISAADQYVREIKAEAKEKSFSKAQREALRNSEDYKRRLAEAERNFKHLKSGLIPDLRMTWRGPHLEWMNAAIVIDEDGSASFPALLGTGGNDGRLDFTNNFFQRLNDLFDFSHPQGAPRRLCEQYLRESLFGEPSQALTSGVSVGQFAPGGAGGANSSIGPYGNSQINPADFVLMLEGTVVFTAAASRRLEAQAPVRASAPFAVSGRSAGYASAANSDESARGEQWMPLWSSPATLVELSRLLAEGRAQIGKHSAKEPLELARAVARLGTARGISGFQRFGYIERNGQSNLAVPLGRFMVPEETSTYLRCLDDLEAWLPRLRHHVRLREASARFVNAERRLADALFSVTQHPDERRRWQNVLLCLADVEAVQVTGSGYKADPIPTLSPLWVTAAYDESIEMRLAVAFALQGDGSLKNGIRRHWVTLDGSRYATTGTGGQQRLQHKSDRVMQGRNGVSDAIAVLKRRMIEAGQRGERRIPLEAARLAGATSTDLARLIKGEVDLGRTIKLARSLVAVDAKAWARKPSIIIRTANTETPDDAWLAIRMALLPWPLPGGRTIGADPAILRRLESGDAASAVMLALRRLQAAGINATVRAASVPPDTAQLWAAGLAFPISKSVAADFLQRLDPNSRKETTA